MTFHDDRSLADQSLLADLRAMWRRRDPVPDGLVSSVILALTARGLSEEYELLTLTASTERLAGVRGASDTRTLTFSSGPVTVMLRVSALADGRRRVDGWVSPPSGCAVLLRCGDEERRTTATPQGRFELADVPAGTATLRLQAPADRTPDAPDAPSGASGAPSDAADAADRAALDQGGPAGPLRLQSPPFTL